VGGKYPQGEIRLVFPAEPGGYFVHKPLAQAGIVGSEQAQREAA
jgi:hypothetical protein